jgi:hypothetical protein
MPKRAMKPIPAEILKFVPVIYRAVIPPTMAKGTLIKTTSASLKLPNMLISRRKIRVRLMGTT